MHQTVLKPCRVPWAVSPSCSGLTLNYAEPDSESFCTVVFGGGRLQDKNQTDNRRIELVFSRCLYARAGWHSDDEGVEVLGYQIAESVVNATAREFWDEHCAVWRATGNCPDSGFYVAERSQWLESTPHRLQRDLRHYVIDGREGYVEVIAQRFRWREWLWKKGLRDEAPTISPVIGEGQGVA